MIMIFKYVWQDVSLLFFKKQQQEQVIESIDCEEFGYQKCILLSYFYSFLDGEWFRILCFEEFKLTITIRK